MKLSQVATAIVVFTAINDVAAFSSFTGTQLSSVQNAGSATISMEYIPS